MRKILFTAILMISIVNVRSQETEKPSVDKSMFGANFGLLSIGFQHEARLARKLALHSEVGFNMLVYTIDYIGSDDSETGYLTAPFVQLEPRFYYSLDRRARKNRNTTHNSANFISLKTIYYANDLEISNSIASYKVARAIDIVPSYGLRRTFAKNFNYEFSFGVGYRQNILGSTGCNCDRSEVTVDAQARIGYTF